MRRITTVLLIMLLCLTLVSSGAFAKGKPSWAASPVKEKGDIVTQQTESDEQEGDQTEPVQTENQAKNRGQAKKLEERIKVRGMNLKFDVPPVIKDGRTLIPVRAIMNGLGAMVEWNAEEQTVTITRDDKIIVLNLLPDPETGKYIATVNDEVIELDVPAQLVSNRTFVPLRFIAQTLGEAVDYDEDTGEINIGDEDTNDEDTNDEDTNDEDTNDEDTNDEDTNDEDTNDEDTNDEDTNDEDTNDEDTNDEDTNDEDTNDENTNDEDTNDEDTNDEDTNDEDTNDEDTNDEENGDEEENSDE